MATKTEEANIAPADNVGLVENAEKQPVVDNTTSEKKINDTTAGLGDLSLAEKENEKTAPASEEIAGNVAAPPAAAATTTTDPAPAATAVPPTTDTVPTTTGPSWPETAAEHPLIKFFDMFEELVKEAQHDEVYGIHLNKSSPFHTKLVLQKFLRANQNDLDKARQQLLDTLKWRKEFDPVKAMDETFDQARFGGLGYVLEVEGVPESKNAKDIVTFNIYGAVKDKKATFGDLEGYAHLVFHFKFKS